jgi:tetratricopeptide (TPR) repeat protein
MQLRGLLEDAAELYRRQKLQAVVNIWERIHAIDPNLPDSQGQLAQAKEALRRQDTERLVNVHFSEGMEHFERGEWAKALSAFNSILELDPDHEIATKLKSKAQEEMARAEAAALLAKRYDKAKRAMIDQNWEDAVDLLTVAIHEDPNYKDVAALLKEASEQLANTQAELDLTLSVKPKRVKPNSDATWTLTISNYSPVTVTNVVAGKKGGEALEKPFDLKSGESKEITFTTHHTTRGARRHILVKGTSPIGRPVQADARASVSIVKPPPKKTVKPESSQPSPESEISPTAQELEPISIRRPALQPVPSPEMLPKTRRVDTRDYREALRRAKDIVDPQNIPANHVIGLIEEGEKHYRIAKGLIEPPGDWDERVFDWQHAVTKLPDGPTWVAPPTPSVILQALAIISREIKRLIGVEIPVQELQNL